jgi:Zn-dependent protease with chaperone function
MVLLDKPEVNAYAGKTDTGRVIVLTTGFLKELKSDDELACVIGHELGHMVCHHTCFEMGSILSALPTPNMFAIAQGMEYEADARGFELMAAGGYDAKAFRAVLAVFASKEKPIPKEVSRHPSADLRTKFLEWYYAYRSQAEAKGPSSAPETRDKVAGPKAEGGD